ncbi:hypothetical protein JF710_11830 [Mycobacterium intracellulare]|uniref:hypothetical protein n=1 Tax=Mycobacterium intracellulare TaxID=1767 RepID=UPI001CDB036C|nr:hypothetical protein [Mycobacterium intracellulare]MCA2253859.1 hypothetical protein [Mycobacterium intracellulare]
MTLDNRGEDDFGDFHFVMVECRNPRHARGKVAKVISYGRFDDEDEWTCGIMQPGIKRHIRKTSRLHRAGLSGQEILNQVGPVPEPVVPKCNLCHRGLPPGFDHRSGDARILNLIAARGDKSVGLDELHALASRRHKGSPTRPQRH